MESPKKLAVLHDYITRERRYGITLFIVSQNWYRTLLYANRNATYFVLPAILPKQLDCLAGDVTSDITLSHFFVHRTNMSCNIHLFVCVFVYPLH